MKRNVIKILAAAVMCSSVTAVGNYYNISAAYGVDAQQEDNVSDTNGAESGADSEVNDTENDSQNKGNTENKDDTEEGNDEDDEKEDTESSYDIIQRINIGNGTLEDYEKLKITGVNEKNIADVNWYIKNDKVDSVERIQKDVDVILNAIAAINTGTITVSYYETAGVKGVLADNIELASDAVLKAKEAKGSTLTRDEIITVFNDEVLDIIKKALNGTASLDDYSKLKVEGVTEANISGVNWYVKKNNSINLSQIKGYAKSMIEALSAINAGTASSGSYAVLGMNTIDEASSSAANTAVAQARASKGSDLTREEILDIVDDSVSSYIEKVQKGEAVLSDYTKLGLTEVTDDNIDAVNYYVKKKASNTLSQIKSDINTAIVALNTVNAGTLSMDYYNVIGIEGVNSESAKLAKEAILAANVAKGSKLTKTEIQNVINEKIVNHLTKITNGEGDLDDYDALNITGVTDANLEDVNWYIPKNKCGTLTSVQNKVNELCEALKQVNASTTTLSYYVTLELDNINSGNLAAARACISKAKAAKESDLTRTEIITALNKEVINPMQRIQKGEGTLDDYTSLGITVVTEDVLDDVNWMNKNNKNGSVGEIKSNSEAMVNALANINKGTTTSSYYEKLGIYEVTDDNISYMKNLIKTKRDLKGTNLNREEITNYVSAGLEFVDKALARISSGTGLLTDYSDLLIQNVTEKTLADVNWYEKESGCVAIKEASLNALNFLRALDYVNKGVKSVSIYQTIGMDDVNDDNIEAVKKAIAAAKATKGEALTRTEVISTAATVTIPINNAVEKIKSGQGTVSDYEQLGITTVTSENLADVNWFVTDAKVETAAKIKTSANNLVKALNTINKGTTSTSYYKTIGITSVTSKNATGIKKAILTAKAEKGENLTVAEIKNTVNIALNTPGTDLDNAESDTVKKIAAGNGTITDYRTLGIQSVTEVNIEDVNTAIKTRENKNATEVKTNVNAILNALDSINKGTTTVSYYRTLGIDIVTQANVSRAKASVLAAVKVKGSNLTVEEIRNVVNDNESKVQEIIARISAGNGELDDYKAIGITTVTEATLEDVNWYAKFNDSSTTSKITANTEKILKVLADINGGTTYASVYASAKIEGVDNSNVGRVKQQVLVAKAAKGSNLNRTEIIKVVEEKVNKPLKDIQEGNGTLEDYKVLEITAVTEGTLADVNSYVKNHDNKTISQIKNSVSAILSALSSVNAGSRDLADYELLGMEKVNDDNVAYISGSVVAARSAKGADLTKEEIANTINQSTARISEFVSKIGAGNGLVSDYQELGVPFVTTANLEDVNWYVKSKADSTINIEKIKQNTKIIMAVLENINAGTTYARYYVTLGITTVTEDNIAKVKDAVLAAKTAKGSDLTRSEIITVVNSAL